jgi:hypothetical protein
MSKKMSNAMPQEHCSATFPTGIKSNQNDKHKIRSTIYPPVASPRLLALPQG